METGVVIIQEPVSTKTNIEEAPAGVILDHSSMKVDKVNLSTVLDDKITSRDCGNNTVPGEADVVNGSGNKETEESECKKREVMKTISVEEDNKIVKEIASETEKDDQGFIFVHEPESFNKNIEDSKIILSDVTLQKEKEDNITGKPEEASIEKAVTEEDQIETKHSPEQVEEISNISEVLTDTTPVKVDGNDIEKSLNSAGEDMIPIKTDEVKEEKDSRNVETSVNETDAEQKATVWVEEISSNGKNIVNETVPKEETTTDCEPIHDVETTKRVLLEVKKEEEEGEMNTDEEAKIVSNEETTAYESESLKENVEPVEAVKNSDDVEQISSEVTVEKEKEEVIAQNTKEVQESVSIIETPTIQGEEIELKASLDQDEETVKSSKYIDEHEQVLVRDIGKGETLVTEAETVDTSTVQEAEILKTNINETEGNSAMSGEEGQETKENTKLSQDLKEDKEQEETKIVKTIISSDEVSSCDVQVEEFGELIEPRSSEIKDESHGREESVEKTVQEESSEEKHAKLTDIPSLESEKYQDNEPETSLVVNIESREKFEEIPSDLASEVDKEELKDENIKEGQRGLDLNGVEEEQVDQTRTDEREESPVVKLVVLPDVEESVEQIMKPSYESSSEVSEETSKTIDEKIKEKPEEETVLVLISKELGEQAHEEKTPPQEESCQSIVKEEETKLEIHEPKNEEVKSDDFTEVSYASTSKELEGDNVVQDEKIENIKENEEEEAAEKIQKSVETVKSHSSLTSSLKENEHETVFEKIEDEKVKEEETMVQVKSEEDTTKTHEKQEEHTEPHSSEIKDESHGREESVEVKSKETVQDEITEEKHKNLLDVVTNSETFEDIPSDLSLNVDKEEVKDEVDGTQIMEEHRGLESNGAEAEQMDRNRTDETEKNPVEKLVVLPDVESVEQLHKPYIESPSEVSEESSNTVDEKVEEKPEKEVTLQQEGKVEGSNGLEAKDETVSVPESIELVEKPQEERSVIDLTSLAEESSQPNDQEKETKLDKHETTNEEVKSVRDLTSLTEESDEVSSALPLKELEGETVVKAETFENRKENEEEDKIQKSVETVEEHGTVSEKIEDEKVEEEESMVQVKSEEDTTKTHEKQEEPSKDVEIEETTLFQAELTRDIEPSLTEIYSMDQTQPEEQVTETCSRDEQESEISRNSENIVNETYVLHSAEAAEKETETNGESVHDVETTKRVLLEVEKEEEEAKTDAEPSLDVIEKEETETLKTVVEEANIVNNEETTTHESKICKGDDHHEENAESVEAIKNSDDAEQNKEMEKDTSQKTEKVQESSTVIETLTIQGEEIESKASLELKEEVNQSSKDIEEQEHVLERDISQCETLEPEAVEEKEDTKPSVDLKEDKEQEVTEMAKTIISSDEVRGSVVDVQAENFGEHTEPCSSEIKDESHGREEYVEVKSKEIVQVESTEEKHEKRLDLPYIESEYQDKEPEIEDVGLSVDQVDVTQIKEEQRGLDSNGAEAKQVDQNRTDETEESHVAISDVESVEQMQKPSLESSSEVSEERSKTVDEKKEEKPEEETVSVQESKELQEQAHEERSLIDLTPLKEESSQPNEQEKETILEKHEPKNEEVSSESFKNENAESMEETENSDDAKKISSEVVGDREKEKDITQKSEEVQEIPQVIETPRANIELKEEVNQSSKDIEEHELVFGRDIPQDETLEAESVDTSTTIQEAAILKILETNINETEAVHSEMSGGEEGQETKEDKKTSLDLKEDKEAKEAETVKTVIFSDEIRPSDQEEEIGEHIGTCSSEIKDESRGREESVELKSKETVQEEISEKKDVNLLDVRSGESEKFQENEPETTLVSKIESEEKSEEVLLDLALKDVLKDEKTKANQVDETQTMEAQRGLDLNEPETEKIDQNRTEETEESLVEKLVEVEGAGLDETPHKQNLLDLELVEKVQKLPLETPELSEETRKTVDEKIEDKPKEEVTLHQEGSYGIETKEVTVLLPEESCLQNEKENETKLQEKNEPTNEEVSNDHQSPAEETTGEVIQISSASLSEEREDETVVEAEKTEVQKVDAEEKVAEKIQESIVTVETVEPHSSLQEHESVSEKTDNEKVEAKPTEDMSEKGLEISETRNLSLPFVALPLDEHEKVTSTEKEETKANETAEVKNGDEEITLSTSKTAENVCIQQEELGKLEAPKLEDSKEDKSLEASETTKEIEARKDQTLPVETSDADNTHSSELVSEEKDQTPKLVEEIHEEETKEPHKLQAEEIFPTEIIPRESSDEASVSMLASTEDEKVKLQEDKCVDDIVETKDMQHERSVSVETEEIVGEIKPKEPEDEDVKTPASPIILDKSVNETLIAETKKGDEDINETETTVALKTSGTSETLENVCIKQEEFGNDEALKVEESKEKKIQEILENVEVVEATEDQTLPIAISQVDQTLSSDLASEQDEQIPKHVEEILEEETKETHKVHAEENLLTETVPRESFCEAPVSMLASGEDEPVTLQESNYAGADTQEERSVSAETEERVVETEPKESEAEESEKSDDQVETSTKLTEVEDENTKKMDIEVAELTDYSTGEADHEDEISSNLPVVEILKGLHTTLDIEREHNDSASFKENLIIEPADQEQKKDEAVVESNERGSTSDIIEELNLQEEHREEVMVQDGISREYDVNVEEKLQEEAREIAECKEEVPADRSLTEVLPVVKILFPSSPLPSEELEHVTSAENQEELEPQQDVNASIQEEKKEKTAETNESVKEENQTVDNEEANKNEEEQDEKLWGSAATKDIEEILSSEVKDDKEGHSVLGSEEEINEIVIPEKQITDPVGVITKAREAEHESNEEHIETQVILDDTKSNDDTDFTTEQAQKDQRDEVSSDKSLTKEALIEQIQVPSSELVDDQDLSVKKPSELIQPHQSPNQVEETSFEVKKAEEDKIKEIGDDLIVEENVQVQVQVQDQLKDFVSSVTDKETSEQEQKSNDLKDVREVIGTNVKLEVCDDEIKGDGHDSVVKPKEETGLIEEKREVEHVKTELEDAIKLGVSLEEKNNTTEKIDRETTKEINQEESKQTYTIKKEIREEEKETNQKCFNVTKNTNDAIEKIDTEVREIKNLSFVSKTQDKPEQKDEVPYQQTREIADEVPKIAEELQQRESEPTEKESARESLSDLIQNVKGTNKNEDATTEPHIEEEPKTEEDEDEDHEHNKDDKTSPDSLVMVEAKDTVSIIKTHKKSQGILSGVGSKVKHSISKVKKVLTGKSSHTTKPSSPK